MSFNMVTTVRHQCILNILRNVMTKTLCNVHIPSIKDIKVDKMRVASSFLLKSAYKCYGRRYTFVALNSGTVLSIACATIFKKTCMPSSLQTYEQDVSVSAQAYSRRFLSNIMLILWNIWEFFQTLLRAAQLACVFLPIVFLYPLVLLNVDAKEIWYRLLLFGLEFLGPIFVKLGQWASTRRDLFTEELCNYLLKLQRRTKPHSWFYTKKSLEKAFGPHWKNIFVRFDKKPIGSGCCAQVYKAWIDLEAVTAPEKTEEHSRGPEDSLFIEVFEIVGLGTLLDALDTDFNGATKRHFLEQNKDYSGQTKTKALVPVAVKVRHPRMETLLRRDLAIMKAMASTVTWLFPSLKWLSLPECVEDFSKLMKAQIDFYVEAINLEQFAENFKEVETVKFPRPLWPLTRSFLLVETYEEGQPMQNYVTSKLHTTNVNARLADLGVNTILKMVFQDNFAHGDLHPGNMLVREENVSEVLFKKLCRFPFSVISKSSSLSTLTLVILDCGITATLDEQGQKCLKDVFTAVANGDGIKVGELFLKHSNHQCTDPERFKSKMHEIVTSALDRTVTLEKIQVSALMTSLFTTMIEHKVKVDGSFSSVVLAIMVLEGLGRTLDPTIDVVEKAKPFLLYSL